MVTNIININININWLNMKKIKNYCYIIFVSILFNYLLLFVI